MGLLADLPIRQVFKAARRLVPDDRDPGRSALCKARQRLGVAPVRLLFERMARPLARPRTPGASCKGWRMAAIGGSACNVPDSAANAAAFGCPKGGRGSGAFPQVRKASLVEVGTRAGSALVAKGIKEKERGEQSMVPGLFRPLGAGMLLMRDRGFSSCKLWQQLVLRGCQVPARSRSG
jgi:hypothetical protein